jgi:hypothetical protein
MGRDEQEASPLGRDRALAVAIARQPGEIGANTEPS